MARKKNASGGGRRAAAAAAPVAVEEVESSGMSVDEAVVYVTTLFLAIAVTLVAMKSGVYS